MRPRRKRNTHAETRRGELRRAIGFIVFLGSGGLIALLHTASVQAADKPAFRNNGPADPPPIRDYSPSSASSSNAGMDALTVVPRGGYQPDQVGIPYSTLFRNTRFPVGSPVTLPEVEPQLHTSSLTGKLIFNLPNISAGVPFFYRGFEPQDADLKIGPFFFKLRAIQGAILVSDNINLTPDDQKEWGAIAITTATVSIIAQITESLRLATTVNLAYLPLENKFGVSAYGLNDFYSLGLYAGPATRAQVAWETQIGGWNVVFSDEFQIHSGYYSESIRGDYQLFDGDASDIESRAGRYAFRAQTGVGPNRRAGDDNFQHANVDFRDDLVVYGNTAAVQTEHLLPGPVRLSARIYREDLWYNQGNRGLPQLREGGVISLTSERVNMRFKPFVSYEAFRTDEDDNFQSILRAGVEGPITDLIHFKADGGYYFGGQGGSGYLWDVALSHIAGPYTQHSISYFRGFGYFHDEVFQGVAYDLRQTLGPRMYADGFFTRLRVEELSRGGESFDFARDETRTGFRLTYNPGPKTTIRGSVIYDEFTPDDSQSWTGRLDFGYNFTDTFLGHFVYQYQARHFAESNLDYNENLFYLSLTKYFE